MRGASRSDQSRLWERLPRPLLSPTGSLATGALQIYGNLDRRPGTPRGMLFLSRPPRNR